MIDHESRLELIKSMHKRIEQEQYKVSVRQARMKIKLCPVCEELFEPAVGHQKYCSPECAKEAARDANRLSSQQKRDEMAARGLTKDGRKRTRPVWKIKGGKKIRRPEVAK